MSLVQNLIFYGNNIYSSTKIHYNLLTIYGKCFAKMKQLLLVNRCIKLAACFWLFPLWWLNWHRLAGQRKLEKKIRVNEGCDFSVNWPWSPLKLWSWHFLIQIGHQKGGVYIRIMAVSVCNIEVEIMWILDQEYYSYYEGVC